MHNLIINEVYNMRPVYRDDFQYGLAWAGSVVSRVKKSIFDMLHIIITDVSGSWQSGLGRIGRM